MELIVKILLTLIEVNTVYMLCIRMKLIKPEKHPVFNMLFLASISTQIGIITYLIWR